MKDGRDTKEGHARIFNNFLLLEITMKTSLIKTIAMASGFASLAAFSVAPAMADGSYDYPAPAAQSIESTKTRAEVRAEVQQAVKDGTLRELSDSGETPVITFMSAGAPASTLTREAVRADTIEWLRLNRADVEMGSR